MKINNLCKKLAYAEKEGIGTWYEFLSKYRLYPRLKKDQKVLVMGLPEKFGYGADVGLFLEMKLEVYVYERDKMKREELLKALKIAKINIKRLSFITKKDIKNNYYDLVVSTEVVQTYGEKERKRLLDSHGKYSKKHILVFVPNAECYAHPKISGLNSIKLDDLGNYFNDVGIFSSGYIDIPLWPAGISLNKEDSGSSEGIIDLIANFAVPILIKVEPFYPRFIKRYLAHMVYIKLEKSR